MLIEVMISALLVGLIVMATFNGFDVASRATADERAHAQAATLAQQDEDRLRSLQVSQLATLNETRQVTSNGTTYTITSKGQFISDTTGSASCSTEGESADYIETVSSVRWSSLKSTRPAVVQTGIVTPPPGGDLIVQVFDGAGAGVSGMTVKATGPSPSTATLTATTGSNGCVIFTSLSEGTYEVVASQPGYVDKDGNELPPASQRTVEVTSKATAKKSFQFGLAGGLEVSFETSGLGVTTGDVVSVANSGMTQGLQPPEFGTQGTYVSKVLTGKKLFPFESNDVVYAGSCSEDQPSKVTSTLEAQDVAQSQAVPPGGIGLVTVAEPPLNIVVMSGEKTAPGAKVEKAKVSVSDTGCGGAARKFETNSSGALPHPGLPFGKYSLCVTANSKKYTSSFVNDTLAGPSSLTTVGNGGTTGTPASAVIYMKSGTGVVSGSTCP